MRDKLRSPFVKLLLCAAASTLAAWGQTPQAAHNHEHPQEHAAPAAATLPVSEIPSGSGVTLKMFEEKALKNNPTLAQAAAGVRQARGLTRQASTYPNPVIGVLGDDNTPNQTFRGGEIGMFGEQRIVTAGKLRLNRGIYAQQETLASAAEEAQQYRVLNSVRALFYEALGAQRLVEVQKRLSDLAAETVKISHEMANVGQADQPDLLQAEIEGQQAEVELLRAEIEQRRVWRQLAAMSGEPSLEIMPLEGDLEALPALEKDSALQKILDGSPEMKIANAGITRAQAGLESEKVARIPDILVRGGFKYHPFLGADLKPVGIVGFFDVGIEIPLFDRNQGSVEAARNGIEVAQREADRVQLALRSRLAEAYGDYEASARLAEKYREVMLPRAQQAYDLYANSFRQMAAAYPQVIVAQRNLFQLQRNYVRELVKVWTSAIEIDGMLLTGGLERPLEAAAAGVRGSREPGMNPEEN